MKHRGDIARDLRYGVRGLLRDTAFAFTTVATLTVALSLVTVVFALFNAYVLRPYAVRDPYSLHESRWRGTGNWGVARHDSLTPQSSPTTRARRLF